MKVWYFVVINIGLLMFLQLAGINTGNDWVFPLIGVHIDSNNTITSVTNVTLSSFFGAFFGTIKTGFNWDGILALLIGAGMGIVAGFYKQASAENLILLPVIIGTLAQFIVGMVNITHYIIVLGNGWVGALTAMIMVPYIFGYILALGEFFRGTD